jgi:hypothetical protein
VDLTPELGMDLKSGFGVDLRIDFGADFVGFRSNFDDPPSAFTFVLSDLVL